ncbi:MAG: hypothetical protein HFH12_13240 [Dorea sp.]|nr:hypothetical protein [Dorea sp.]
MEESGNEPHHEGRVCIGWFQPLLAVYIPHPAAAHKRRIIIVCGFACE